jgi:hypothetical protein
MKLHSLILPLVAIVPVLSMSLPAQSQLAQTNNISQIEVNPQIQPPQIDNRPQIQQQINEVVDFGSHGPVNTVQKRIVKFILPPGHSTYSVTAANPFDAFTKGTIDSNREGEVSVSVNPRTLGPGNYEKIITIKSDRNLIIKRVLLKVKVTNATVPHNPDGPPPEAPKRP